MADPSKKIIQANRAKRPKARKPTPEPGKEVEAETGRLSPGDNAIAHLGSLEGPAKAEAVLELQRRYGNRRVMRMLGQTGQAAETTEEEDGQDSAELAHRIDQAQGQGRPLDTQTRAEMETSFEHDFGGVRVHTGRESESLNQEVNATAFTTGRDIFFSEGTYSPGSTEGKKLLAHELTHVVQQESADGSVPAGISSPQDASEREADRVAQDVVSHQEVARQSMEEGELQLARQAAGAEIAVDDETEGDVVATEEVPGPNISDDVLGLMEQDVGRIIRALQEQVMVASEEEEVVEIIERWTGWDDSYNAWSGYQGTDYLDKFIFLLKIRAYTRSTAGTAWIEQTALVYDDLWNELEDERLDRFKALLASSKRHAGSGPGDTHENFWATLGKQEAMGIWGILKGMGTSAAGMVDVGAWAMTEAMRAYGMDVENPEKAAEWLALQYDISAEAVFGQEWKEGEDLVGGMNAAEIGTKGGEIIWGLVMIGAGGQAEGLSKTALTAHGIVKNIKSVEEDATKIADLILKMQQDGKLSVGEVLSSPDFWKLFTSLAANIFGAVSGGTGAGEITPALEKQLLRAELWIEAAEITAMVGKIIEIGLSDMSPQEKEDAAAQELSAIFKKGAERGGKFAELKRTGKI